MELVEHQITYPEPKSSTKELVLSGVINEDKPPVVIIFGWVGCLDKHLAKYSQIYEERGFVTLRYTAPMKVVFWKRDRLVEVGESVVKHLEEAGLDNRPIFIHCFSNGGAILYVSFSGALEKLAKPIRVAGVIFDSCPGGPNILSFYRAISTVVGGNAIYNWSITTVITVFLWLLWYYDILKDYIFRNSQIDVDPFRYLRRQRNVCPQFIVYSMSDNLVFYNEVEEFIVIRKNMGVDISSLCFKDSAHVRHYITHKEDYVKSICEFIRKCLTNEEIN